MKNSILLGLLTTQLVTSAASPREGQPIIRTISVGLSPYYAPSDNVRVRNALIEFILKTAPGGAQLSVQDAFSLQGILTVQIPQLSGRYDSPQARVQELKLPLAKLALWFKRQTNILSSGELNGTAALKVPEWIDQVRNQVTSSGSAIVLIGNPLRIDPREPAFNMAPDLYPSDRHLSVGAEDSVFSVSSKTSALESRVILWSFLSEGIWANELHAQQVRRFWTLWTAGQRGTLASFSPDLNAVLVLAPQSALSAIGRYEIDPTDQKLTMRTAQAREIPRWMPAPATQPAPLPPPNTNSPAERVVNPASVRPNSQSAIPTLSNSLRSQTDVAGHSGRNSPPVVFAVGLMWDSHADVNLYLKPQSASEELFFGRLRTREGRYIHDFRDRNSNHDYEWIELWENVDPTQVEAWINLFEGSGPVHGTVSVLRHGKRYEGRFSVEAIRGNHGADRELARRATSPNWCKINLQQILVGETK